VIFRLSDRRAASFKLETVENITETRDSNNKAPHEAVPWLL